MSGTFAHLHVASDDRICLAHMDPGGTGDHTKESSAPALARQLDRLRDRQQLLYADGRHGLLVVLQAMDAGGKDGTIRHVFSGLNPLGTSVASFKVPTTEEAAHDFLWRVHRRVPRRGEIAIFNRSHYEDVLVARVHSLVPRAVWERRFEHIRHFEALLADAGVTVRKFFLHISRDEQAKRLAARAKDPAKRWKLSASDEAERQHWDAYQEAYEEALSRTSTPAAPWYVVPADHKWYRNLVVSTVLADTLDELDLQYPQPDTAEAKERRHSSEAGA